MTLLSYKVMKRVSNTIIERKVMGSEPEDPLVDGLGSRKVN